MEVCWEKCTGTCAPSIFPITHIKPIAFQLPVALQPPWGEGRGSSVFGRWASHRVTGQRRTALALYFGRRKFVSLFFLGATIWSSARGRASRPAADAVNTAAAVFHHGCFLGRPLRTDISAPTARPRAAMRRPTKSPATASPTTKAYALLSVNRVVRPAAFSFFWKSLVRQRVK